jgi:Zn ribbon nucleic-acid-binding protein
VVVEEAATWRDAQTGETLGAATVATVFELDGGLVTGSSATTAWRMPCGARGSTGQTRSVQNQHNERSFMQTCTHLDQIRDVEPSAEGCEECLQMGDTWVHLRECLSCGHVGCCDSSKNKHATKHFRATEHPIVQSFQPGEDWIWCYVDEVVMEPR